MKKQSAVMEFVDAERAKGKSDKAIQHDLLDAGWHMDIVRHALGKKTHNTPNMKTKAKTAEAPVPLWQHPKLHSAIRHPYTWIAVFVILILLALFA